MRDVLITLHWIHFTATNHMGKKHSFPEDHHNLDCIRMTIEERCEQMHRLSHRADPNLLKVDLIYINVSSDTAANGSFHVGVTPPMFISLFFLSGYSTDWA